MKKLRVLIILILLAKSIRKPIIQIHVVGTAESPNAIIVKDLVILKKFADLHQMIKQISQNKKKKMEIYFTHVN